MSEQSRSKLIRGVMDVAVGGLLILLIKTEKAVQVLEKKAKGYLSKEKT